MATSALNKTIWDFYLFQMLRFFRLKKVSLVPVSSQSIFLDGTGTRTIWNWKKKVQVPSRSDVGPVFFPCVRFSGSKNTNRSEFNKRFGQKNRSENEWVGEVRPRCLHLFKRNKLTALNLRQCCQTSLATYLLFF